MKLSVIIPARNEEKRIGHTLTETHNYLSKQDYDYEILVVVDSKSTDNTAGVVDQLISTTVTSGRLINQPTRGKGGAVKIGVENAQGQYIMFMDADNATPISEIEKFWPFFEQGYSVVIGSRYLAGSQVTRKQPIYRIILSRLSNILIQIVAVPGIKDTQLGFKVFTKEAAKTIFKYITVTGWGFDMEVLTVARVNGFKIKEVPVLWREFGGSTLPMSAYLQSLRDLFKIKLRALGGKYKDSPTKKTAAA